MKIISLTFIILGTLLGKELFAQNKQNEVKYEAIEWTNVWFPSATKNDLPRVLLIGNSITQGYYDNVEKGLKNRAYVARYTSSKGILDPELFEELKNLLKHHKFSVIHFNNGLHGIDYTPQQYEKGLNNLMNVLKRYGQGAELIGATSTRVLPGFVGWKTDEENQKLIETRNEILVKVCGERNIEVDNLYDVTKDHPDWFSGDKIHYNATGYQELSKQVVNFILKKIDKSSELIKSYDVDFNWGPGGPNAFAKPGLWNDADPIEQVDWYYEMGCNVIQSFAVSCNGYAWYKNGIIPEQPGLKHDFLPEMVKYAHTKGMKVFGYFCVGANTKWGLEHPDLSYGIPSNPHIPFTKQYLDYLCASIADAIKKTNMDGFMIDWVWNPGSTMEPYPPLKWLPCEQVMFKELMHKPFPGKDKITAGIEQAFRRKAIDRCWKRIKETTKKTDPDCKIWLTSCQLTSKDIAGSAMLKEADWILNEAGDIGTTQSISNLIGKHTKLVTCLANWNGQDPVSVVQNAIRHNVGIYGFAKPMDGSWRMKPVDYYLTKSIDSLKGDEKNIAVLIRAFKGLPLDYIKN